MTLADALEAIGAPEALVQHVRAEELDVESAWDACDRGEYRVWIAAGLGAPIEALIEAAAAAVLVTLEQLGDPSPALADAVELAASRPSPRELAHAAEICEQIAEGIGAGYREPPPVAVVRTARASALVAHAAEGLAEGEARREAVRLERARTAGALLGAGAHAFLPAREDPPHLDLHRLAADPAQSAWLFAVAACAEALVEACAALATVDEHFDPGELDRVVRTVLEDGEL